MFIFRKKPMTKRERKSKIKEFRSAKMNAINEKRRARREAMKAGEVGKGIALDTVTRGLYSKGIFSFHASKSVVHNIEARKQKKESRRAANELKKDRKRRLKG